jgi:hypothetical protein
MAATKKYASISTARKMSLVSQIPPMKFKLSGQKSDAFPNDQELIKYALGTLEQAADPDDLICSDAVTLDRTSLKQASGNFSHSLVNYFARVYNKKLDLRRLQLLLLFPRFYKLRYFTSLGC